MRLNVKSLIFSFIIFSIIVLTNSSVLAAPASLDSSTGAITNNYEINEDAYWELVQRSLSSVQNLKGFSEEEIKQRLAKLAEEWEALKEVKTEDGQTISMDNGYLLDSLHAEEPDLEKIIGLLNALLTAHKEYPNKIFSTADLSSLHTILARPEFLWAEQAPNPINEIFQRVVDRFLKWLNSLMGNGMNLGGFNINLFSIIASILLALVIFFVFKMVFADFVKETQMIANENSGDELLTSEVAFEKAQSLSRGGDFRSAVRYLYLSSLLVLDERGLLRYDRSKTNREYLRSISNAPELAQPLEDVIEVFDNVWYGYHSLEENSFKHYSDRVKELKEKKG